MDTDVVATCRVKLPKTFLAVNLSDAFSFQEKQHQSEAEGLEMKPAEQEEHHEPAQSDEPIAADADSTAAETTADTPTPTPKDMALTAEDTPTPTPKDMVATTETNPPAPPPKTDEGEGADGEMIG